MRRTTPVLMSLVAVLALSGPILSASAQQPAADGAPDPGFRVEIQGVPNDMDEQFFAQAVLAALPEELLNPEQNFSRTESYDRNADYRLLMVFHGGAEEPQMAGLCARTMNGQAAIPEAPPAEFQALTTTTKVAAAFCRDQETLSTATDQMTGEVMPDKASFRFLVGDVAKQLFPSGFQVMPGTPAALTAAPPG